MNMTISLCGVEFDVLFGGHERGRRIERNFSMQEVLTYLELAQEEILNLKFNEEFAIVSSCRSKAIIGVLKNCHNSLYIDIKTVLNTEGYRDVYLKPNTTGIYLSFSA